MGALAAHIAAEAFLEVVVESLDTLPVDTAGQENLAGAPARVYVATGQPAIDCEQVVAWVSRISEVPLAPTNDNELAAGTRGVAGRVNFLEVTVMVVRCVPSKPISRAGRRGLAPDATALDTFSVQTNADAWVVWCGVNVARKQGRIADVCEAVTFGQATPLVTSGGYGGWQLPIQIQLQGYKPNIVDPGSA